MRFKRNVSCGELRLQDVGKEVVLSGWVSTRRDHGGVIFVDLRNRDGVVQVVFNPKIDPSLHAMAHQLRSEYVISIKGRVVARPKGTVNPKIPTGEIEVVAEELEILSKSKTPPFDIMEESNVAEEIRLRYRYLDLRRPSMYQNLLVRHRLCLKIREFLDREGFVEVETPFLIKSTPEGARDYLVPSRLNPGRFYALPQSPQLFKQILMVGGIEKYFQIVRCFRDEDLRADRQPEFTQLDIEASFVEEDDIIDLIERLLVYLFEEILRVEVKRPFERIGYKEAISRFGTDVPDVRFGMELVDVSELAKESRFEIFRSVLSSGGKVKGIRAPSFAEASRKEIEHLSSLVTLHGAKGLSYFKVENGSLSSPIAKFFQLDLQHRMINSLKANEGDLLLLVADKESRVHEALGALRVHLAKTLNLVPENEFKFIWVLQHPLFEYDESEQRMKTLHHPFTSPMEKDLPLLDKNPLKVRARAYDIVLNGIEIGGGSIRIHKEELQKRIFQLLDIDEKRQYEMFGFLLEAFRYGAPPHGGIALGIDRLLRVMLGCSSIRDVIAFPKTQSATCLMSGAPFEIDPHQLKELSIEVKE
jgi:aspartyl-tRNA synthetase